MAGREGRGGGRVSWRDRLAQAKAVAGIMHGSRAFGGPFQATLMPTNRCNLRCIHCYYYSPLVKTPNLCGVLRARGRGEEEPDREELVRSQQLEADPKRMKEVMDELIGMGTRQFLFSGYGEPFMHRQTLAFMERAKGAGCWCSVDTNGTLLDRSRMDALVAMGFDEMRVTTLAGTAEAYRRTHPESKEGVFEGLRENLTYLARRKEATGVRQPVVRLVMVVMSENAASLMDFARFAGAVRADRVTFRPINDAGDEGLTKLIPTAAQAARVRDELGEVEAYLESAGIAHNAGNFRMVFRDRIDTRALYRALPCVYGWLATRIDVTGEVYGCCRCYEPLGNINEGDFRGIWTGERYRRFRREAYAISKRGTSVTDCDCDHCGHYAANVRVYASLHPVRYRRRHIAELCPADAGEGE